jgi:hypothetical protein
VTPLIQVSQGGANLVNGVSLVDLGTASQNSAATSKTFTVTNVGVGTLVLGNVIVPTGFVLAQPMSPTSSLASGASATFQVAVDTSAPAGSYRGSISFTGNSFQIPVVGAVTNAASPGVMPSQGTPAFASMPVVGGQTITQPYGFHSTTTFIAPEGEANDQAWFVNRTQTWDEEFLQGVAQSSVLADHVDVATVAAHEIGLSLAAALLPAVANIRTATTSVTPIVSDGPSTGTNKLASTSADGLFTEIGLNDWNSAGTAMRANVPAATLSANSAQIGVRAATLSITSRQRPGNSESIRIDDGKSAIPDAHADFFASFVGDGLSE